MGKRSFLFISLLIVVCAVVFAKHDHQFAALRTEIVNGTLVYPGLEFFNDSKSKYNTQFILPECPCAPVDELCDYHCCFCQLKCDMVKSSVSEELWLKDRFEKCNQKDEDSGGVESPFEQMSLQKQVFEAFPVTAGVCKNPELWANKLSRFFSFLCLYQDNYPSHGFFYPQNDPVSDRKKAVAGAEIEDNLKYKWRRPRPFVVRDVQDIPSVYNHVQASTKGHLVNEGELRTAHGTSFAYSVSGGPECFNSRGLHRRGTTGLYECHVYVHPGPSSTETSCEDLRKLLDVAATNLIRIQIQSAMNADRRISLQSGLKDALSGSYLTGNGSELPNAREGIVCSNMTTGVELMFHTYKQRLLSINVTFLKASLDKTDTFTIKLVSTTKDIDHRFVSRVSRFLYEIYYSVCPEQYCWRDAVTSAYNYGANEMDDYHTESLGKASLALLALFGAFLYRTGILCNFNPFCL